MTLDDDVLLSCEVVLRLEQKQRLFFLLELLEATELVEQLTLASHVLFEIVQLVVGLGFSLHSWLLPAKSPACQIAEHFVHLTDEPFALFLCLACLYLDLLAFQFALDELVISV